jgi:hypothetical protein
MIIASFGFMIMLVASLDVISPCSAAGRTGTRCFKSFTLLADEQLSCTDDSRVIPEPNGIIIRFESLTC